MKLERRARVSQLMALYDPLGIPCASYFEAIHSTRILKFLLYSRPLDRQWVSTGDKDRQDWHGVSIPGEKTDRHRGSYSLLWSCYHRWNRCFSWSTTVTTHPDSCNVKISMFLIKWFCFLLVAGTYHSLFLYYTYHVMLTVNVKSCTRLDGILELGATLFCFFFHVCFNSWQWIHGEKEITELRSDFLSLKKFWT